MAEIKIRYTDNYFVDPKSLQMVSLHFPSKINATVGDNASIVGWMDLNKNVIVKYQC